MAETATRDGLNVWTMHSEDGAAQATLVPEFGGLVSSLRMTGPDGPRELLYQHDFFADRKTKDLRGGIPFLFPICGRLERDGEAEKYLVDEKVFRLPIHGVAPNLRWTALAGTRANELVMELYDGDAARARFPFNFHVTLKYRLEHAELTCRMTVKNESSRPMPYYAGFHPYFLTPLPGEGKEDVMVEVAAARRLTYNKQLTRVVGEADPPSMPLPLNHAEVNEMLLRLGAEKEIRIRYPDGLALRLSVEGREDPDLFPYVQFYTMPDKPFFCAEPWMGYPNMMNEPPGKVHTLRPGGVEHAEFRLSASW